MAKETTISACARLSGLLLLASAVPHATLGTAEILMAIKTGDVRASMVDTLHIIWIFSTIMLVLSGIWVLFLAAELRQLKRRAWWQGLIIGLGYVGGSIGAIAVTKFYAYLLFYTIIGLLLLLPLLRWAGSFRGGISIGPAPRPVKQS
ncbi:MAG TPA: hypothetical protein VD993_15095 [Chitinophagaceae bacterium]|nr:hypothetical protein [Chitinophagaceae bacterium]